MEVDDRHGEHLVLNIAKSRNSNTSPKKKIRIRPNQLTSEINTYHLFRHSY